MSKWKETTTRKEKKQGLRVFVHDETGDIKVIIYPKAPK